MIVYFNLTTKLVFQTFTTPCQTGIVNVIFFKTWTYLLGLFFKLSEPNDLYAILRPVHGCVIQFELYVFVWY